MYLVTNTFLNIIDKYNKIDKYHVAFTITTNSIHEINDAVIMTGIIENSYNLNIPSNPKIKKIFYKHIAKMTVGSYVKILFQNGTEVYIINNSHIFPDIEKTFNDLYKRQINKIKTEPKIQQYIKAKKQR